MVREGVNNENIQKTKKSLERILKFHDLGGFGPLLEGARLGTWGKMTILRQNQVFFMIFDSKI